MNRVISLLVFLFSAVAMWAQGSPPFYTDDAATVLKKQWEFDFGLSTERARDATRTQELPSLDIAYGLTDRFEIEYGTSWLVLHTVEEEKAKSGMGNSVAGVKWRFLENEAAGWALSVNPQVEVNTLNSSRSRGLVEDNTAFILPFQFQKSFGKIDTAFNVGRSFHAKEPSETDGWFAGAAIGRKVSQRVHAGVELFGETSPHFKLSWLLINAGALYEVNDQLSFSGSIGTGVAGDGRADYVAFFGMQFLR
jgi:hypothetical protein